MSMMMDLTTMSQREAPKRLRVGALRQLAAALEAQAVMFFSIDAREGGARFGHVMSLGEETFKQTTEQLAGSPLIAGVVGPQDHESLQRASAANADVLTLLEEEYGTRQQGLGTLWWQSVAVAHGFIDQLRMSIHNNEGMIVGVVIALTVKRQYSWAKETLRAVERSTRDAILLADMFERPEVPQQELHAIYAKDGTLMLASQETPRWLDEDRREHCATLTRALLERGDVRSVSALDGAHLELELLEGDEDAVLVTISAQRTPQRFPVHKLSERQRKIAEFLALGASPDEIGRHFVTSAPDISQEVRTIYHLLRVTNRGDLIEALRCDDF